MQELKLKLCLFIFFQVVDLHQVVEGGPRSFNNQLLVMRHLQLGEDLLTVQLGILLNF